MQAWWLQLLEWCVWWYIFHLHVVPWHLSMCAALCGDCGVAACGVCMVLWLWLRMAVHGFARLKCILYITVQGCVLRCIAVYGCVWLCTGGVQDELRRLLAAAEADVVARRQVRLRRVCPSLGV